jgi:hypothetical protein
MRKLMLEVEGQAVEPVSEAVFERQITASGLARLRISVPDSLPDLLQRMAGQLPSPYFLLYVLHTPRGEGEPGRYQSGEVTQARLRDFLTRYQSYLASDARHDLWVYSPQSRQTLVWDRHNQMFAEGEPLEGFVDALLSLGFTEAVLDPIGDHFHYYRAEFDEDAAEVLGAFNWHRTPLQADDEQAL